MRNSGSACLISRIASTQPANKSPQTGSSLAKKMENPKKMCLFSKICKNKNRFEYVRWRSPRVVRQSSEDRKPFRIWRFGCGQNSKKRKLSKPLPRRHLNSKVGVLYRLPKVPGESQLVILSSLKIKISKFAKLDLKNKSKSNLNQI